MLMSTHATRYAHMIINARNDGSLLPLLSEEANLTIEDAYDIARSILNIRIANGEKPIGRKIGFSNRNMWRKYGKNHLVTEPIWCTLFNTTVEFSEDNTAIHLLSNAQQPRIEPELVFKLSRTPEPDIDLASLADCFEWMAHAFEIVVSPFKDWIFDPADAIAAFGLHRTLIIGEPKMLSSHSRQNLPSVLASTSLSLSCSTNANSTLRAAGYGRDVLDSPVHALFYLHKNLQKQNKFDHLHKGELITTGSWTDAQSIKKGEVWSSAFSQLNFRGLNLSLN